MPIAEGRPRVPTWLWGLVTLLFGFRAWWISTQPDLDSDAYGHYRIGIELSRHPSNFGAHWVWLPLYHYGLALAVRLGASMLFVRFMQSACMAFAPIVLYRLVVRRAQPAVAARIAIAYALSTSCNVLGVSAQQEGLFALLILLCVLALDTGYALRAGCLLAAACLIRYEAWGAAALIAGLCGTHLLLRASLGAQRATSLLQKLGLGFAELSMPPPPGLVIPPLLAMVGWFLAHRRCDGTWFGFLRELYTFTHTQRVAYSHGILMDALWFPLWLPLLHLGALFLLVPFGLRQALSRGWIVPLAIYMFLLASYAGGGALGASRYYGSLIPYLTWAGFIGFDRIQKRFPRVRVRVVDAVLIGTIAVSMASTALRMHHEATSRRAELRVWENDVETLRTSAH